MTEKNIPDTCFEIIHYFFLNKIEKQQSQEIGKILHPDKPNMPKIPESSYYSMNTKCEKLWKIGVLTRKYLPCGKKNFHAWFYSIKKDMELKYFKEIAKYYLNETSKQYIDRLIFMESDFVQQYITENFVKKICKEKKIVISEFYSESIFPSILSCFPSSLFLTLFYEDEDYGKLEMNGKKLTKKLENKKLYRFFTFLKLSIYNDLWQGEYLAQDNWTQIEFEPYFKIYFEYQKDFNDLTTKELKSICKKHNIVTTNLKKQEIIKSLEKKLKTTEIEEKSENSITLPGSYLKKFK